MIGFLVVWIYILNWFDSLTQIPYYQALSRAMAAISGPPSVGSSPAIVGVLLYREVGLRGVGYFPIPILQDADHCVVCGIDWS